MSFVSDYLKGIPGGLEGYPEQVAKASGYRAFVEGLPQAKLLAALPGPVRPLITNPEPVTAWIPEVHNNVIYLASLDAVFADTTAFFEHYEKINETLLSGPLYRVLMLVASPAIVLRGAASRWASFHRGVGFELGSQGPGAATVVLTWPTGLFNRIMADAYARAFLVTLRLAGAKDVRMEVTGFSETGATYRGTWR